MIFKGEALTNHAYIAVDTLGIEPTAAISNINIVIFNILNSKFNPSVFSVSLNIDEQIKNGSTVTAGTIFWFINQSTEIKKEILEKLKNLSDTSNHYNLVEMLNFCCLHEPEYLWCRDPFWAYYKLGDFFDQHNLSIPFMAPLFMDSTALIPVQEILNLDNCKDNLNSLDIKDWAINESKIIYSTLNKLV